MSWRDIVAKSGQKPDYLDFDKDGDKEEPMTEALESAKKACGPNCGCKSCGGETEKSAYKSRRCETCNSKVSGIATRCKKCENEDVEKKISLRGNRCSNPDCMAKVQNAGDMCDKCKNKSRGRGFTR